MHTGTSLLALGQTRNSYLVRLLLESLGLFAIHWHGVEQTLGHSIVALRGPAWQTSLSARVLSVALAQAEYRERVVLCFANTEAPVARATFLLLH